MSEKIYKYYDQFNATVSLAERDDHSLMTIEVKVPVTEWKQDISELDVVIDRDVIFSSVVRQILGYYTQAITIEPYSEEKK